MIADRQVFTLYGRPSKNRKSVIQGKYFDIRPSAATGYRRAKFFLFQQIAGPS